MSLLSDIITIMMMIIGAVSGVIVIIVYYDKIYYSWRELYLEDNFFGGFKWIWG